MTDRLVQGAVLARIQQAHPKLTRVDDDDPASAILSECVTGTVLYECPGCTMLVTVEPDGTAETWERGGE